MDNGIVERCPGFDENARIYTVYSPGGIASDPVRISVPDESGLRNMADADIDEVLICGDGSDPSPVVYLNFVDKTAWREMDITAMADYISNRFSRFDLVVVTEEPAEGDFYTVCIGSSDALQAYAGSQDPDKVAFVVADEYVPLPPFFYRADWFVSIEGAISDLANLQWTDDWEPVFMPNGPHPDSQIIIGRFGEYGGWFQWHWNNVFTVMTPDIPLLGMGMDHSKEWTLFGSGDFDGDGRDGLLWIENATGCVYMHNDVTSMDEVENRTNCLGVLEAGYTLKGSGDFSGSGIAGVLLQGPRFGDPSVSTNYGLSVWARKEDGTTFAGWLGALVNTWQEGDPLAGDLDDPADINARNYRYEVVAIGDFNGDGVDDVMIRNTMPADVDGRAVTGSGDVMTFITGDEDAIVAGADPTVCCVGRVTGDWEIVGFGDFDGDGVTDVLLSDGKSMAGWRMSEGRRQSDFGFGDIADGLKCVGVTDVNGDGTDDILFRNAGDQISAWTIRDGVVTGTIALP